MTAKSYNKCGIITCNTKFSSAERQKTVGPTKELKGAPTNEPKVRPTKTVFNCWGGGAELLYYNTFAQQKEKRASQIIIRSDDICF